MGTLIIPDATIYDFGILTSNVHMSWMRAVAGRLKSDYRYSKDIVYNKRAMKLIYLTSRSATIELENDLPYYNSQEFDIFLNSSLFRKKK